MLSRSPTVMRALKEILLFKDCFLFQSAHLRWPEWIFSFGVGKFWSLCRMAS